MSHYFIKWNSKEKQKKKLVFGDSDQLKKMRYYEFYKQCHYEPCPAMNRAKPRLLSF